jgi:DNA-binding CsgD family transcriptional regulator
VHRGDLTEARRQLTRAMRARSSATYVFPFVAVRLRLQLARVYLAIADPATARQLLRETDEILTRRRALGILTGEVEELRRVLAPTGASATVGRLPLTPAELRLLPYLQTHLTASGIAERLFVSSHTVKAEVKSIYRKLGVSSRHDAVQKATATGLLGALAGRYAARLGPAGVVPAAAGVGAEDDPDPDPDDDQVGDHLAGDHQPRRLGLSGNVAEPDRGEHGNGEVQRVGVRQVLAEVAAECVAMAT